MIGEANSSPSLLLSWGYIIALCSLMDILGCKLKWQPHPWYVYMAFSRIFQNQSVQRSLSDRASIKVFFLSKQILQEFLVHKCPLDPLCVKMDQHGSTYPDNLLPTSCFYQSEFNRDVCGLQNRLVGLFGTLLSQMYSGMKTFSYWFILVPTLFYWGWYSVCDIWCFDCISC